MRLFHAIADYFRGVLVEIRKVVWPTYTQLFRYLVSVIMGLLLATIFVGGVDYLLITYVLPLFIKK